MARPMQVDEREVAESLAAWLKDGDGQVPMMDGALTLHAPVSPYMGPGVLGRFIGRDFSADYDVEILVRRRV